VLVATLPHSEIKEKRAHSERPLRNCPHTNEKEVTTGGVTFATSVT
jgi:hypothetical protein